MKKHDEGYVLVYVTVVLLVFCLVATTILTGALNNLRNQQNAIAKMEDQYAAAGEIEKVIASMDALIAGKATSSVVITCSDAILAEWNAEENKLTLTANCGVVVVSCGLNMEGASVTQKTENEKVTSVTIANLSAYTYASYEIGGVGE